jgi:hypothetical protein
LKKTQGRYSAFTCLISLILITGCGLKSNPTALPIISDNRQIIRNTKAVALDDAVVLKWDFRDIDGRVNYINIEKSEVGSSGNECKDCPRSFESIAQVPIKGIRRENKEYAALSFTDKKVVRGKIYNYRLMLCDDSGMCLEESAAEINFK